MHSNLKQWIVLFPPSWWKPIQDINDVANNVDSTCLEVLGSPLDFGKEFQKAWELTSLRSCQKILHFVPYSPKLLCGTRPKVLHNPTF